MLSEEKIEALKVKVAEWGKLRHVPANIQGMIIEMGAENPRTPEEKREVCAGHLWSEAIIKWYDDFVKYLESQAPKQQVVQPSSESLLLSLKTLRQFVDQLIEQVENGK